MLTGMILAYAGGLAGTACLILRSPGARQTPFLNAGVICLWPVYWGFVLTSLLWNRSR